MTAKLRYSLSLSPATPLRTLQIFLRAYGEPLMDYIFYNATTSFRRYVEELIVGKMITNSLLDVETKDLYIYSPRLLEGFT